MISLCGRGFESHQLHKSTSYKPLSYNCLAVFILPFKIVTTIFYHEFYHNLKY